MAGNVQAMCGQFLADLLAGGIHSFKASGGGAYKAALFLSGGTIDGTIATYTAAAAGGFEVPNTGAGGYSTGGIALTNANASSATLAALHNASEWTPAGGSVSWGPTFTAAGCNALLVYLGTGSFNAVSVHTFTSQTITSGTLTLTFPTPASGAGGLINFAT